MLAEAADGLLAAGAVEPAAEARMLLGGIWWVRGDRDEAFRHMEQARNLLADRPASAVKASVLQRLARLTVLAENFDEAIAIGTESLRLAEQLGLDEIRARNLNTLGLARVDTGDLGGLADLERALELAHEQRSIEEAIAAGNLAWTMANYGNLPKAWDYHQDSVRIAQRRGLPASIRWYRAEHVYHAYWQGHWDEALAAATAFIAEIDDGSSHYMEACCRYQRGAIRLARGDQAGALADSLRAVEAARLGKDPQMLHPALAFRAFALLTTGDRAGAAAVADELAAAWARSGVRPQQEAVDGAWVFAALDRTEEFTDALDRAWAQTPWHDAARRIAAGDPAGAAEVYASMGSVPDEAYSRLRAAAGFVQAGRRTDADAQLQRLLPILTDLGATAWIAQAEPLLTASA